MTDTPEDVMKLAAKVVDDAEAECRKERYLFGFPTSHGKETLDKHIARAIIADRAAKAARVARLEEAFKNAMAMHLYVNAAQYLFSNTRARSNGAVKATHHMAMTIAYVSALYGVKPDDVRMRREVEYKAIHDGTAEAVTDRLETIGFDIDGFVDERIIDRFLSAFHVAAVSSARALSQEGSDA